MDGQPLLLFCTNAVAAGRDAEHQLWAVPAPTVQGPWDVASAQPIAQPQLYAPRLVPDGDGWSLIGFIDHADGRFVGELSDPIPVRYEPATGLVTRPAVPAPTGV